MVFDVGLLCLCVCLFGGVLFCVALVLLCFGVCVSSFVDLW